MTNTLTISRIAVPLVAAFALLTLLFAALPASAQTQIQEQCTLSRDVKIKNITIVSGTVIKPGSETITDTNKVTGFKEWGTACLINTINTITDWAFFILLTISFVFIAYAGFVWMTSGGDPEKQGQAGKMIMAALVGIVIAIVARVIPAVITGVLT